VDIIGVIIAGIIIGLLGKFFAPGNRDNIPFWLTIVCGIGGVGGRPHQSRGGPLASCSDP
jgi:uncharacterized membrane protein YeaQ/YmgE (transglycosylase-associated protein family)